MSTLAAMARVLQLLVLCLWGMMNVVADGPAKTPASVHHDYCIVGAGPAGLQLAYFLQQAGRDYVVFERADKPGSFFKKYPRHRTLLSLNKRFTGKTNREFNLRHDWNSLLSDDNDLLFGHFSTDLYPQADDMVRYLDHFYMRWNLSVQFNTTIRKLRPPRPPVQRTKAAKTDSPAVQRNKTVQTDETIKDKAKNKKKQADPATVSRDKTGRKATAEKDKVGYWDTDEFGLPVYVNYNGGSIRFLPEGFNDLPNSSESGKNIPSASQESDKNSPSFSPKSGQDSSSATPRSSRDSPSATPKSGKDSSTATKKSKKGSPSAFLKSQNKSATGESSEDSSSAPPAAVHMMEDQRGFQYSCRVLVLATGMWVPKTTNHPSRHLLTGYENVSTNPEDFVGKKVGIFGRGNSGMEVARAIYGVTAHVHLISRRRLRLAWHSQYSDDIRGRNTEVLDSYMLKSLDGFVEMDINDADDFYKTNSSMGVYFKKDLVTYSKQWLKENISERQSYDIFVRCLGFLFDFSIFWGGSRAHPGRGDYMNRYIVIGHNYEVDRVPDMFVAGAAAHSLDLRRSAGGNIRGFRYSARALWHLLEWRYHGIAWPCKTIPTVELLTHLSHRLSQNSGLYHMVFMLADLVLIPQDYGYPETVQYCEEVPTHLVTDLYRHTGRQGKRLLLVVLETNLQFTTINNDIFRENRGATKPSEAFNSSMVHPVLYYFADVSRKAARPDQLWFLRPYPRLPRPTAVHHVLEDAFYTWTDMHLHLTPLRQFLEHVLGEDMRMRFAQSCLVEGMISAKLSSFCKEWFLRREQGLTLPDSLFTLLPRHAT